MKKFLLNSLATIVLALAVSMIFQSTSKAQGSPFEKVIPFVNNAGYFGFFDQGSGIVYMYDGHIEKCLLKVQMVELGEPATTLKAFDNPIKKDSGY